MRTIRYVLFILIALGAFHASAQKAFVMPSPTGANDSIVLYIDVNQSTENGLKQMLLAYPEEVNNVYLWSWNPAEPTVGNGSWNNSTDSLKLRHEGNLLFSIKFVPTQFYGVDGPMFFSKGISCLAKLKDGNAHGDMQVGEAKTEDINITIIPKLCDELYCMFPQQGKPDDFLTITYDNTKETNPNLQGLAEGEVYLYIRAAIDLFNSGPEYASQANTPSTPALKMKAVPGEPGHFKLTIIPADFFADLLQPNQSILKLRYTVVKPGFTHPQQSVPYKDYVFSNCID
jgi:hypothetical protein